MYTYILLYLQLGIIGTTGYESAGILIDDVNIAQCQEFSKLFSFSTNIITHHTSTNIYISLVESECKTTPDGSTYRGTLSVTSYGEQCLAWVDSHTETDTDFVDGFREAASNFCRNPTGDPRGPWCHTASTYKAYCDVQYCGTINTTNMQVYSFDRKLF